MPLVSFFFFLIGLAIWAALWFHIYLAFLIWARVTGGPPPRLTCISLAWGPWRAGQEGWPTSG